MLSGMAAALVILRALATVGRNFLLLWAFLKSIKRYPDRASALLPN